MIADTDFNAYYYECAPVCGHTAIAIDDGLDISANGTQIVGWSDAAGTQQAAVWDANGGGTVTLAGFLPALHASEARAR